MYPLVFHPTQAKEKQLLFEDKRVEIYSFPLKHSLAVTGFLFVEKQRDKNIIREMIDQYSIPVFEINRIKKGADFITEKGEVVFNENLTTPAPKPLSYAFCTDTVYRDKTTNFVAHADLLYHESTFLEAEKKIAKRTNHSTAIQAATVAKNAQVGHLLLGHFSARYDAISPFENEAKTVFAKTTACFEGMKISVSGSGVEIK